MDDPIDPKIWQNLAQPGAYPSDPSASAGVESIQTHISHIFLSSDRVYKFRKPVDFGFVQFSTRAERNADCDREVALNRRLAPDVYLGVAPLLTEESTDGRRHWVGPLCDETQAGANDQEHCVVMRRLPTGRDALSLLDRDALTPEQIDRLADTVAEFHGRNGLGPTPFTAHDWRTRILDPVEDNLSMLAVMWDGHAIANSVSQTLAAVRDYPASRFDRRRLDGRAIDGHGDLHLDHIWFEQDDSQPLIIDCIEFNETLRRIDAASEVAFSAMDLAYRGRRDLAERFLGRYAQESDDYDLYSVVDFFISYRAAVRAKVASMVVKDPGVDAIQRARAEGSARRHVELAAESVQSRGAGALVLVGGLVGTGKSTVARALAELADGVVIDSDRIRKRICGLAPSERVSVGPDEGIYAPKVTERVYSGLVDRARPIVESGRVAILDATFGLHRHRALATDLAHECGAELYNLEARCSEPVALERLARREAAGSDPSDAGPAFYANSVARFEPCKGEMHLDVIRTDCTGWRRSLGKIAADIRSRDRGRGRSEQVGIGASPSNPPTGALGT